MALTLVLLAGNSGHGAHLSLAGHLLVFFFLLLGRGCLSLASQLEFLNIWFFSYQKHQLPRALVSALLTSHLACAHLGWRPVGNTAATLAMQSPSFVDHMPFRGAWPLPVCAAPP